MRIVCLINSVEVPASALSVRVFADASAEVLATFPGRPAVALSDNLAIYVDDAPVMVNGVVSGASIDSQQVRVEAGGIYLPGHFALEWSGTSLIADMANTVRFPLNWDILPGDTYLGEVITEVVHVAGSSGFSEAHNG